MHPYLDIALRSASVYVFMLLALRLLGKKELSQLNTADVVLILLISNAVQNAMVGPNVSLEGGLMAASVLFVLNALLKKGMYRFGWLRQWVQDQPYVLVHQGKVEQANLSKLELTHDELLEAIREHGLESISQVKWAILEVDGNISIISGDEHLRQTKHKRRIHKSLGKGNP